MPLHILCVNKTIDEGTAMKILKLFIEKYPEAAQHADNKGRLPIHLASVGRSPEFCQVLIEAAPDSVRMTDAEDVLPLHVACYYNSLASVEYLYGLNPTAINRIGKQGHHPIHAAISGMKKREIPATAVEIVQFLLNCDPNQKLVQYQGNSLLQCACGMEYKDSDIEAVIEMIKVIYDAHPASVHNVSSDGRMPLHVLCKNSKMGEALAMQILKFLLEKHPEGVRHANTDNMLPLHCASLKGSLATVEYLHGIYPEAIDHTTTHGHYPIHKAISGTKRKRNPAAAIEIVKFLLDCDPNVKLQKYRGRSLLRFACRAEYNDSNIEAGIQIIGAIYDVHPEAIEQRRIATDIHNYHQQVQAFINKELVYARQAKDLRLMATPDDDGRLPLHTALQNNVRLGSIKLLVKGNPHAVQSPDNSGALPLHVACEHHDSTNVIQFLVELDTTTLDTVDRDGNTALHYACRTAKFETIVLLLEKYDAVSVSKRNAQDKLPIELLWESAAVLDRESIEYTGSIFRLLKAHPETIMSGSMNTKQQVTSGERPSQNGKKRKYGDT